MYIHITASPHRRQPLLRPWTNQHELFLSTPKEYSLLQPDCVSVNALGITVTTLSLAPPSYISVPARPIL